MRTVRATAAVIALVLGACGSETTTTDPPPPVVAATPTPDGPASFDATFSDPEVTVRLAGAGCEGVAGPWTGTITLTGQTTGQGTTTWHQPATGTGEATWNFRVELGEGPAEYTGRFTVEIVGPPKAPALAFDGTGHIANAFASFDVPQFGTVPLRFGPAPAFGC